MFPENQNYKGFCFRQLSGRNCSTINLKAFSEQYITNCGTTIGPNEPVSYNGSYSRDDFFPAKDGNGTR